ncbi:photosynthetic complex assembly protein [Iodidimonas nitroreducens]|uniref:Photosynthetic complex assembly protein n=1 Tax=Iodidimonas nitroreducens TaxID=1236968 RepID=A0A5A7N9T0_9PROT|nr:photosynthetic complex putative assembly protein PuhB [Iodidimonas nitroreducens]GAK32659.1 putative 23.7 kDa protein in puhA 5'region [alpha proteobacterium Q-1]GER04210.1 photosynthetic complex assembly protein [Iodidimonas nitroreducens]
MSEDDHFEPVYGLPEKPPADEHILWQGAPQTKALARHAFHIRLVLGYFGILILWQLISGIADQSPWAETMRLSALLLIPAVIGGGILWAFAWGTARTTAYTITNRRVVMRCGIALSKSINIPFTVIQSAAKRTHSDHSTDLVLSLEGENRPAFFLLWPHVRPWRINRPEPMLRGLSDGDQATRILARALADFHQQEQSAPTSESQKATQSRKAEKSGAKARDRLRGFAAAE